jgi:arylsulfatase A-like enzyme
LRGLKFTLYEGGIRVPFIARWPGRIAPGSTSDLVSDFADMAPTFAELARADQPTAIDGVSLVPTLLGRSARQIRRSHHYWEAAPQQAVREGDWKLNRAAANRPVELYQLRDDIGEKENLASAQPELTARLTALLSSARTENPDFPLAPRRPDRD